MSDFCRHCKKPVRTCAVCKGKGYVMTGVLNLSSKPCSTCNGSGKVCGC